MALTTFLTVGAVLGAAVGGVAYSLVIRSVGRNAKNPTTASDTIPSVTPSPDTSSDRPPNLHALYKSDFNRFLASELSDGVQYSITNTQTRKSEQLRFEFRVHSDFGTRSKFVSVYISMPPANFPNATYELCKQIAEDCAKLIERADGGILSMAKDPGDSTFEKSSDLLFTGKIYLYHEDFLTLEQYGDLEKLFRSKNMIVQFRGLDYATTRWLQKKAMPPTKPLSEPNPDKGASPH
jgi:hypothetical protein